MKLLLWSLEQPYLFDSVICLLIWGIEVSFGFGNAARIYAATAAQIK
jgi:hypothetical protein